LPGVPARTEFNRALEDLAGRLLGGNRRKREQFADQIAAMHRAGIGKDFIIIHSPGGWGNTSWEGLLAWEMSIVTGVTSTLDKLGYSSITVQYLRSGKRRWAHLLDIARDIGFFMTGESPRASVLAEGLRLLEEYLPGARLILVGASQGAAFNNATVKALNNGERVYSIELGTFFPYMKHRLLTPRTLAIDSNGLMPDPICHRNLRAATKEYFFAVGRWIRLKMNGQKVKFTHCVNTPGHEYAWVYPAVHTNITVFLKEKFGKAKQVGEVGDEPG
jgi:hypothetical protein